MQIERSSVSVMLYLIACALHNEKPEEDKVDETDMKDLFRLARCHSLSAIVYMALQGKENGKQKSRQHHTLKEEEQQ